MATRRRPRIEDSEGIIGHLRDVLVRGDDEVVAIVELANNARVTVPFTALEHHDDGGYSLSGRWRDYASRSETGAEIPVIAERVVTEVREGPQRRVRIRRRVVTQSQVVETPIWRERIEVEHVPVNAFVDRPPKPRHEGNTLIIPCVEEVVVVEKRLRVREEVRVRVIRERHIDRQTIELRRHEADVEPIDEQPTPINKHEGEHS